MRKSLLPGGKRHKKGKKRSGRHSVRPVTSNFDNG